MSKIRMNTEFRNKILNRYVESTETETTQEQQAFLQARENVDSVFQVINFTNDIDKANDMLQGYNLIEKDKDVVYSIVRYEQPLKLTKEMEC